MDYNFSRLIPALLLAVLPLAGESAGGLNWEAPAAWKSEPRQMRAANYVIPPAAGDNEPGECAVYYFGPGQGGGVEANVRRWISQFEAPNGGPADALTKRSEKTVNGIKLTILDVAGTYLFKPFPMAPQATKKPGYRMLAAIAEGRDAPVFFKLTAPEKTVQAQQANFMKLLESVSR